MEDQKFALNLLRLVGAQLALQNGLTIAREMFGKSYFSLGVGERMAVDHAQFQMTAANYQMITPEFLEGQQAKQPMGFPIQPVPPTPDNTP